MRVLMVEDAEDLAEGVMAHLARSGVGAKRPAFTR